MAVQPIGPFIIPQFIDTESKIIGPITTRQFLIMLISALFDFIFYKIFLFNTFLVLAIISTIIFGVIAFLRINGMPFHFFFLNLLQTLRRPQLRIWHKAEITAFPAVEKEEVKQVTPTKAALPPRHLASLSLIVNTGGAYREEEDFKNNQ